MERFAHGRYFLVEGEERKEKKGNQTLTNNCTKHRCNARKTACKSITDLDTHHTSPYFTRASMSSTTTSTHSLAPYTVSISGTVGAGKTTLVERLCEAAGWKTLPEPFTNNRYLGDFYTNRSRWGLTMQIDILAQRYATAMTTDLAPSAWRSLVSHCASETAVAPLPVDWRPIVVQDRAIGEDVVFAQMLHDTGVMSDREFETYMRVYAILETTVSPPDLIVFLDVRPEVALQRVRARNRPAEATLDLEYLRGLDRAYSAWLAGVTAKQAGRTSVLVLDWNADCNACDQETATANIVHKIMEARRASDAEHPVLPHRGASASPYTIDTSPPDDDMCMQRSEVATVVDEDDDASRESMCLVDSSPRGSTPSPLFGDKCAIHSDVPTLHHVAHELATRMLV